MITTVEGNILDYLEATDDDLIIIAQGCNAQGKMRTGFAKVLRDLNEGIYKAYISSGHNLGTVSYYELYPNVIVANCITQENFGYDGAKYTSYDAVDSCFKELNSFIEASTAKNKMLYFPLLGSVLGGGNNEIIKTIIDQNVNNVTKIQFILKD